MVQFGRTVERLRELNYRVMDYKRLATVLKKRTDMWEDTFASLLQEEIEDLKRTAAAEQAADVPLEVVQLLGGNSRAEAACNSSRNLVTFVNSEACRKIIKKYHKTVLTETAAGNDVSRAGENESRLYQAICELQALYPANDMNLIGTVGAPKTESRVAKAIAALVILVLCCVVAFEPIFVAIAAARTRFSEASVVVLEALISSGVGLVIACGQGHLRQVLNPYHLALFFPTAALRAAGSTLELLVLRWINPMTFLVISQLRLVMTAAVSWAVLRKFPNSIQIRDCVVISLACLLYSVLEKQDDATHRAGSHSLGIALTVLAVTCKVGASVWQDYALKKAGNLSVPVQSSCISIGTILPAFAGMRGMATAGFGEEWAGFGVLVVGLSCYILLKNWLGNLVVTRSSSVVKYVIYAMALPVAYVTELALGWRLATAPTIIAILLVCVGVWMFAEDEPHAPTKRGDSESAPALRLVRRFSSSHAPSARTQGGRRRPLEMIAPAPIIPESWTSDEENPAELN